MPTREQLDELQDWYDEALRRDLFRKNEELADWGHEARRRKLVADPTQGGLVAPEEKATPFPSIPTPLRLFGAAATEGVDTDFASRVERARRALEGRGIRLRLSDETYGGKRSLEQQKAMFRKHGPGRAARPSPHAPHVRGQALDLGAYDAKGRNRIRDPEVRAALEAEGLHAPLGHEPWHWEPRRGTAQPQPKPPAKPTAKPAVPLTQKPPVTAPKPVPLTPEEKQWQQVETRWQKQAPAVRAPGYTPAEGGPVETLWKQRATAALGLQRVIPQLEKQLKALDKKHKAGKATPQDLATFEQLAARHEKYANAINATLEQPPKGMARKSLFNSYFYPEEGRTEPTKPFIDELGSRLWQTAQAYAPTAAGWVEEIFGPATYAAEKETHEAIRADWQRKGLLKPLPRPSKDPKVRQRQTDEKNHLLGAVLEVFRRADAMRQDPVKWTAADRRAAVENSLGQKLTPWQLQLYPALMQNVAQEMQLNRKLAQALDVDLITEGASEIAAALGGGVAGKLAVKALAKGLVRPTTSLLSREGVRYLAAKGAVRLGGEMAGGAAGGAAAGGIVGGYQAAKEGKPVLPAVASGVAEGALQGAVFAGALSVGGMGIAAARRARPRIGVLGAKAKAAVTARPKPKAAPAELGQPGNPGPQVLTPDGAILSLREANAETLRAIAEAHTAAGDTASASRAQQWVDRHEAYEQARAWEMPAELVPEWQARWSAKANPLRQAHDLLDTQANNPKYDPQTRAALRQAADETILLQKDIFRTRVADDPPTPIAPPSVSPWRQLTPEVRRALPKDAQRALLVLDGVNSTRVLDPDAALNFRIKGNKPSQWEAHADSLFQRAQAKLVDEVGEVPVPGYPGPRADISQVPPAAESIAAMQRRVAGVPEETVAPPAREVTPEVAPPPATLQPEAAAAGAVPSAYQAAVRRAREIEQPVGALEPSPTLRTRAEIVAQRQGLPPASPEAVPSAPAETPPVTEAPAPLRSAAEVARQRAGMLEPVPARPGRSRADLARVPRAEESMAAMRQREAAIREKVAPKAEPAAKPTKKARKPVAEAKPKAKAEHPSADVKPAPSRLTEGVRLFARRTGATWEIAGPVRTDAQGYKRVDARLLSKPEPPKTGPRIYDPVYSDVGAVRELLVSDIARDMKFAPPTEKPTAKPKRPDAEVGPAVRAKVDADAAAARERLAGSEMLDAKRKAASEAIRIANEAREAGTPNALELVAQAREAVRIAQEAQATILRSEGDAGPKRQMSDTLNAVEGAPHKGRRKEDC